MSKVTILLSILFCALSSKGQSYTSLDSNKLYIHLEASNTSLPLDSLNSLSFNFQFTNLSKYKYRYSKYLAIGYDYELELECDYNYKFYKLDKNSKFKLCCEDSLSSFRVPYFKSTDSIVQMPDSIVDFNKRNWNKFPPYYHIKEKGYYQVQAFFKLFNIDKQRDEIIPSDIIYITVY